MPINSFLYPGVKVPPPFSVTNSLRFDDGSSEYLHRTPSSSGSSTNWTYSVWVKRSASISGDQRLLSNGNQQGSGSQDTGIIFMTDDTLRFDIYDNGTTRGNIDTKRTFRDLGAWYHFVFVWNSSSSTSTMNGSATDRMQIWVNGVQETELEGHTGSAPTIPAQDANDPNTNSTSYAMRIGTRATNQYFNGYIAEAVFVDGQSLGASSFGEYDDDSGIWKPKDVSGLSLGTNGFYLDFEDSSSLGNDAAGSNNLTVVNLTSIDQSTDTPDNNFCTMNPLVPTTNITFSEGNCKMVTSSSDTHGGGIGTFGLTAGKWYWEVKIASLVANHNHGVISELTSELYQNATGLQNDTGVTCWRNDDGGEMVVDGTATSNDYGLFTDGQIMGIALDMDNYNISIYRNGSALVTDFNMSTTRGTIFPMINTGISTTSEVNFGGTQSFTISSGNSDANGYGNFEYAPPSGYYALCTKNLAEYG